LCGIPWALEPVGLSAVGSLSSELGTTVVEFDRELSGVLSSETEAYAAYRVLASAGMARRLTKVVTVSGTTVSTVSVTGQYAQQSPVAETSIVLDAAVESLSKGHLVGRVAWQDGAWDVVSVKAHKPISWEVAPGTSTPASKLEFAASVPTLLEAVVDASVGAESALQVY